MKPPKTLLALLVALAMVAAACGGDDGDPVATGEPQTAEPAEEPADEPMDEPMEEESAEEAMDEPMEEEPAEEPTDEPAEEEPAEEPEAATDDAFPVTIAAGNGEVTIEARPERIVSISTVATETLFAIGAGDQVIAVDSLSNFPPEAPSPRRNRALRPCHSHARASIRAGVSTSISASSASLRSALSSGFSTNVTAYVWPKFAPSFHSLGRTP